MLFENISVCKGRTVYGELSANAYISFALTQNNASLTALVKSLYSYSLTASEYTKQ